MLVFVAVRMFTDWLLTVPHGLPLSTGYILEKMRFLSISMKTKAKVRRYPSKISLPKDLAEGYPAEASSRAAADNG